MQALTSHPAHSRALVHRLSLWLLFTRGVVVFALVAWAFALRFLMRCPRRTALILAACLQKIAMARPGPDHPVLVSVPLDTPVVSRHVGRIRRRGRTLAPAAQQLHDAFVAVVQKPVRRR